MTTRFVAAAAQMGPIPLTESRQDTVARLIALLEEAAGGGAGLVVFPEAALTPFFPHWEITDPDELRSFYESSMPDASVAPLFARAAELGVAFHLGYTERTPDDHLFNSAVLVDENAQILLKHRKIHLPGYTYTIPGAAYQNLEKRYFETGDLGFGVARWRDTVIGLAICNDRRWAETYRVLSLRGAEVMCVGYNTPVLRPQQSSDEYDEAVAEANFSNEMSVQAGAYQNALWVIGTAKAGVEEGVEQIGGSLIVAPTGRIVAQAETLGDEVVLAEIDLEVGRRIRSDFLNFDHHRRPETYGPILDAIPDERRQPKEFVA